MTSSIKVEMVNLQNEEKNIGDLGIQKHDENRNRNTALAKERPSFASLDGNVPDLTVYFVFGWRGFVVYILILVVIAFNLVVGVVYTQSNESLFDWIARDWVWLFYVFASTFFILLAWHIVKSLVQNMPFLYIQCSNTTCEVSDSIAKFIDF